MGRKPEGKAEKILKSIGKNVDSLITDIKESEDYVRLNINKRVSELNKNKESLSSHFSKASETAKNQWQEAKPNLERAGQELRKAMQTLFTKRAYR